MPASERTRRSARRRLSVAAAVAAIFASAACRNESSAEEAPGRGPLRVARGDVVVVERAAAEFFQARVLSVAGTELKVQTTEDGEPVIVATSDAYAVSRAPAAHRPGDYAICADRRNHWGPCRIVAAGPTARVTTLDSAEETSLPADRILTPSAVTALNIRRRFESAEGRKRFAESARAAGLPPRPRGWLPEPREPIVARRGAGWYSAHVAGLDEDGSVRVAWEGAGRFETLPAEDVVPIPPFAHAFVRGDFALAQPAAAGEAWRPVRIEALGPAEAVVTDTDGQRLRVGVREMVPLVAERRP